MPRCLGFSKLGFELGSERLYPVLLIRIYPTVYLRHGGEDHIGVVLEMVRGVMDGVPVVLDGLEKHAAVRPQVTGQVLQNLTSRRAKTED